MTHEEASELLGAYALDAVEHDEGSALEEHLASCPRCRAELDGLREAAAAMGNSVEPLPDGLWSSIVSRLPERPDAARTPPMPRLDPGAATPFRKAPSTTPSTRRRGRNALATAVALAVAAAAVAVVLGISLVRADHRVSDLQAAAGRSSAVAVALRTPGHRVVELRDSAHSELARFVVVPDGRGYLVSSRLPSLGPDRTYQLWGVAGGHAVSLGLLGHVPGQATFTMAGSRRPSRLSITAEPAGGTMAPTGAVVATGTV